LCVTLGVWPRLGAALIMLFLVCVTPVMHDFWNEADAGARMAQFANFMKNVALFAAACVLMAVAEPWPASVHLRHDHVPS